ncbi:MAG: CDP-alcohol phosphatidyltransferase family protein [Erysipelotrichia bacterium]|jgi:cardiolipin synthase|nr:CDP-alcohol phosphatidyltransferase family protein [Erysipelotrichia bacterium]
MKNIKRHIPNFVTILRIIGTIILLPLDINTDVFLFIYAFTGFSDILDGYLARKLNAESVLGSKLDTAADFVYYTVTIIKLMPLLWARLSKKIWILVTVVVMLRLFDYLYFAFKFGELSSTHSLLNKMTSVGLFGIPFIINTEFANSYCWIAATISLMAVLYEIYNHSILLKDKGT